MKKIIFFLLISTISIAQNPYSNPYQPPVKVEVTKQTGYSEAFNAGLKANAATASAAAANRAASAASQSAQVALANAQSQALLNNSENIEVDFLKGNSNKYKYIFIEKVSGWKVAENFVQIINQINNADRYSVVSLNLFGLYTDEAGYIKTTDRRYNRLIPKINESKLYSKETMYSLLKERDEKLKLQYVVSKYKGNVETLFLEWNREAVSRLDRVTRLTLKNSNGETVYQAEYKNKGYSEMLKPLISNYEFSKEDAKRQLIELREYLDLGIITQEDFDRKSNPLKKVLLGN